MINWIMVDKSELSCGDTEYLFQSIGYIERLRKDVGGSCCEGSIMVWFWTYKEGIKGKYIQCKYIYYIEILYTRKSILTFHPICLK